MATTFPTSKQTFTAPAADDSMNSVPAVVHQTVHDTLADTLEAVQDFVVGNIATHALTAVSTAAQTRTLDLANGPIQKITADQEFTLAVTAAAGRRGLLTLYIYNSSVTPFDCVDGANAIGLDVTVGATSTVVILVSMDGTRGILVTASGGKPGDYRPA